MTAVMNHPADNIPVADPLQNSMHGITSKLRHKVITVLTIQVIKSIIGSVDILGNNSGKMIFNIMRLIERVFAFADAVSHNGQLMPGL